MFKRVFNVGDFVFAKVKGYQPWPATVSVFVFISFWLRKSNYQPCYSQVLLFPLFQIYTIEKNMFIVKFYGTGEM